MNHGVHAIIGPAGLCKPGSGGGRAGPCLRLRLLLAHHPGRPCVRNIAKSTASEATMQHSC